MVGCYLPTTSRVVECMLRSLGATPAYLASLRYHATLHRSLPPCYHTWYHTWSRRSVVAERCRGTMLSVSLDGMASLPTQQHAPTAQVTLLHDRGSDAPYPPSQPHHAAARPAVPTAALLTMRTTPRHVPGQSPQASCHGATRSIPHPDSPYHSSITLPLSSTPTWYGKVAPRPEEHSRATSRSTLSRSPWELGG